MLENPRRYLPVYLVAVACLAALNVLTHITGQKRTQSGQAPLSGNHGWLTALKLAPAALAILGAADLINPIKRIALRVLQPQWLLFSGLEVLASFPMLNRIFLGVGHSFGRRRAYPEDAQ